MIRSDVVRKELAGLAGGGPAAGRLREGIYTPEWTERTYAECLRRAEALLFEGERVAGGRQLRAGRRTAAASSSWRRAGASRRSSSSAGPSRRSSGRGSSAAGDDASDADWSIYLEAAARWEESGPLTRPITREVDAGGNREEALVRALEALREFGLWYPGAAGRDEAGSVSCW